MRRSCALLVAVAVLLVVVTAAFASARSLAISDDGTITQITLPGPHGP
jgi:hypothetical protein